MDHWSASKIVGKILASEPAPKANQLVGVVCAHRRRAGEGR